MLRGHRGPASLNQVLRRRAAARTLSVPRYLTPYRQFSSLRFLNKGPILFLRNTAQVIWDSDWFLRACYAITGAKILFTVYYYLLRGKPDVQADLEQGLRAAREERLDEARERLTQAVQLLSLDRYRRPGRYSAQEDLEITEYALALGDVLESQGRSKEAHDVYLIQVLLPRNRFFIKSPLGHASYKYATSQRDSFNRIILFYRLGRTTLADGQQDDSKLAWWLFSIAEVREMLFRAMCSASEPASVDEEYVHSVEALHDGNLLSDSSRESLHLPESAQKKWLHSFIMELTSEVCQRQRLSTSDKDIVENFAAGLCDDISSALDSSPDNQWKRFLLAEYKLALFLQSISPRLWNDPKQSLHLHARDYYVDLDKPRSER